MIDGLTGWAEAVPISDQSVATIARAVYTEWIYRYGGPEQIHSDRGVQLESAVFSELCAVFGVDKTRTTPYRPQANGKCERFNRTLVSMLRRAVQKKPYEWEPLLAPVLQASRSTVSEAIGFTPYRLVLAERCAFRSILARRCSTRRAKSERLQLRLQIISSGVTELPASQLAENTAVKKSDTINEC